MPRSVQEITELLLQGNAKLHLREAINHENRLNLHNEISLKLASVKGATQFLDWVRELLSQEKYNIFLHLFQFPAFTNELTGDIFNQLYRVFSGRNKAFNYQFTDMKIRDDWEWYRQEKLEEPEVWENKAWETMRLAINSVMVVDMHREKRGMPEPYFYFMGVESIVDYKMIDKKQFEWIAFEQGENHIAFFDIEQMTLLQKSGQGYTEEHSSLHGLGYCPARFFWTDNLGRGKYQVKQSPVSKLLSKLDWLLFFEISKHHLDLYAPYPIYWSYSQDCDFTDPQTGAYCDDGYLRTLEGYHFTGAKVTRCPICASNSIAGVGSMISVPKPDADTDMRDPVGIKTVDRSSLDYNVEEVQRLKVEIFEGAVGRGMENTKEAVNEMQVSSGFETKTSILTGLKRNFEQAQLWVTETVCKLRYGGAFLSASINYGTEFYVYTLKDLYEKYSEAKKSGASDIVLDTILDKIIEIENINNPVEMQRVYILKHIEPFRHLTKEAVVGYYKDGIITDENMVKLKLNFSSLIQRFERENTNIIEFGIEMEFNKKIDLIQKTLISYDTKKETVAA